MTHLARVIILTFLHVIFLCTSAYAANKDSTGKTLRLAVVNTPHFSGLMAYLLPEFEEKTGFKTEIYSGSDVYAAARDGRADIVISHYGKAEVEHFIQEGFGFWPRTVFSNQMVIIGPESDPAKIKGLSNATEALKQIAKTNSPYIMNNIPSVRYLTGTLMAGAKLSENRSWFLDEGKMKGRAIKFAEKKQGYVIFGAFPFLRFKQKSNSKMKILVHTDPILQRVMVSVIVNPKKIKGVNLDAAKALQTFLLSKRTQARIAAFRAKGANQQLWWPAARHNAMHSLK